MSRRKRSAYFKTKAFLPSLRDMLSALPGQNEKQEIKNSFTVLIEFLSNVRDKLDALPAADDMKEVNLAIKKLEELFAQAGNNPLLASAVGLRTPSLQKRSKLKMTDSDKTNAKAVLTKLESLPVDKIRSELTKEEFYPMSQVRAIGSLMGLRSTAKLSRDALVHQIATKIANYRGYKT